jgi:ankyrin repeat protein
LKMGAGASSTTLPSQLDRDALMELYGNQFSEELYEQYKDANGMVSSETLAMILKRRDEQAVDIETATASESVVSVDPAALLAAAKEGNLKMISACLDSGVNIESKNDSFVAPVPKAGEVVVMSMTDLNDLTGKTALMLASEKGHVEAIKLLIERGANVVATDKKGNTSLLLASGNGHVEAMRILLDKGAIVEAKTNFIDETPLIKAAGKNCVEAMELLLERGASTEAKNYNDETPLIISARYGDVSAIRLLVDKGANVEAKDRSRYTPLIVATICNKSAVIEFLLDRGANIEAGCWAPLFWASSQGGSVETMKALLDRGANIEIKDSSGSTPLKVASFWGKVDAMTLLLDRGADIEAQSEEGRTPLIYASCEGQSEAIELLLERGANIGARDNNCKSALDLAKNETTKELLLSKGAASY